MIISVNTKKVPAPENSEAAPCSLRDKARYEVYGEEMIEKLVRLSGKSGRLYLPLEWVGKNVRVIRIL